MQICYQNKKENVNLPHFVGLLNLRIPGSCYAQAFVRQGKFLWNYCVKIEDDFDEVRKEIKTLDVESYMNTLMSQQDNDMKLMVNEEAYKENEEIVEETETISKSEEVGDYNVKHEVDTKIENVRMEIPKSKGESKRLIVSLSDDEEELDSQNECDDEDNKENKIDQCECEIVVKSNKKCKKAYTQLTKSILRGVQLGIKRGIKETIESLDLSFFDQTNKAVAFVSSQ